MSKPPRVSPQLLLVVFDDLLYSSYNLLVQASVGLQFLHCFLMLPSLPSQLCSSALQLGVGQKTQCASHASQTGRGKLGLIYSCRLRQEVENSAGAFDRKRLHQGGEGTEQEEQKCPETSRGLDCGFS